MWFGCVLWMSLYEWLVWFDDTEGKRFIRLLLLLIDAVFVYILLS